MGRTPDQFPGQRLEESIRFLSGTLLPTETAVMQYVTGSSATSGSGLYFNEEGVVVGPIRKLINSESHARLVQLIHLSDNDGPFEGFSGAVKDTDVGVFSTGSIWYTDSSKTIKLLDKTITRSGILPTKVVWNSYFKTGSIILTTAIDEISYSGIFEQSRTRSIIDGPPIVYESVQVWLDANDLETGTLASGSIWPDKSVNGFNGTFINSPSVSNNWIKGRKKITLNGTNQYITIDDISSFLSGNDMPISISLVFRLVVDPGAYIGIFGGNYSAAAPPYYDLGKYGAFPGSAWGFYNQGDSPSSIAQSPAGTTSTSANILVFSHTGTVLSTWFNNVVTHNAVSNDTTTKTIDLFTLGALRRAGTAALFANMEICEFVSWDIPLSSTEAYKEFNRLSEKWLT